MVPVQGIGEDARARRMQVVKSRFDWGVSLGVEEYPRPGRSELNRDQLVLLSDGHM